MNDIQYDRQMSATYTMRYDNRNALPEGLRAFSLDHINTLLHLGWGEDDARKLLTYVDYTGDSPDWSDATWSELRDHFIVLDKVMNESNLEGTR